MLHLLDQYTGVYSYPTVSLHSICTGPAVSVYSFVLNTWCACPQACKLILLGQYTGTGTAPSVTVHRFVLCTCKVSTQMGTVSVSVLRYTTPVVSVHRYVFSTYCTVLVQLHTLILPCQYAGICTGPSVAVHRDVPQSGCFSTWVDVLLLTGLYNPLAVLINQYGY